MTLLYLILLIFTSPISPALIIKLIQYIHWCYDPLVNYSQQANIHAGQRVTVIFHNITNWLVVLHSLTSE